MFVVVAVMLVEGGVRGGIEGKFGACGSEDSEFGGKKRIYPPFFRDV